MDVTTIGASKAEWFGRDCPARDSHEVSDTSAVTQ